MNRWTCLALMALAGCFKSPVTASSEATGGTGGHASSSSTATGSTLAATGSSGTGHSATLATGSTGTPAASSTSATTAATTTAASTSTTTATSSSSSGAGSTSGTPCAAGSFCLDSPVIACCHGACTNIGSDPQDCGGCGVSCGASQVCLDAVCVDPVCSATEDSCALANDGGIGLCCGNGCANIESDPANCGGCQNVCAAGSSTCLQGNCASLSCAGIGDGQLCQLGGARLGECCSQTCVDESSDTQDCGNCNSPCPGGDACVEATCVNPTCLPDSGIQDLCADADGGVGYCCGATCSDIEDDPANCGGCGLACAAGQSCRFDQCLYADCATPNSGGSSCALPNGSVGLCCAGSCVEIYDNTQDCGGCGIVCPAGALCVEEEEGDSTTHPPPFNSSRCAEANFFPLYCADAGCPAGLTCDSAAGACLTSTCGPGSDGDICVSGAGTGMCCDQVCVDEENGNDHCGACGHVCTAGTSCQFGYCTPVSACTLDNSGAACQADGGVSSCCHGVCGDIDSDSDCGACGVGCPAGSSCSQGECVSSDGGFAGCTTFPCPAGEVCANGRCESTTCPTGETGASCAYGDGLGADIGMCCGGVCSSPDEPTSCGGCGRTCASGLCIYPLEQCLPVAGEDGGGCTCFDPGMLCVDGACVWPVGGCAEAGTEELCATDAGSVAECCATPSSQEATCAAIDSDPANCGACGFACAMGQSCSGGQCTGLPADCQGQPGQYCRPDAGGDFVCCSDGCVDLDSSSSDCGICGNACPVDTVCIGRECIATACNPGTFETPCVPDGGESECCGNSCVNLQADSLNCGGCFNACNPGTACVQGGCLATSCAGQTEDTGCRASDGGFGLCCSNACIDFLSDPLNCGGCGISCDGGTCSDEVCR